MGPGETILATLFEPRRSAVRILDAEPFVPAMLVVVLASLSKAVNELLLCRGTAGFSAGPSFVVWAFIVELAFSSMVVIGGTLFITFFLHVMSVKVRSGRIFWAMSLGFAPWMFAASLGLVATFIGGSLGVVISLPVYLLLLVWHLGILVAMMAAAFDTETLKALLAVAMSFCAALVLCWSGSLLVVLGMLNFLVAVAPPVS